MGRKALTPRTKAALARLRERVASLSEPGEGFFVTLLLLACAVIRLVALDADPPSWLSWSTGLQTDEGFYTLDARHEALFGTWAPGNFHDRLLSPLLSLLQQFVFQLFGAGTVQARLISVAFGLLTVGVFWWGLRQAYDGRTAWFGSVLLGLAPPFVFYNRLALQETPTVFWLVLAFALWAKSHHQTRPRLWLTLAGVSGAVAVMFKALAVFALPGLAVGLWRAPHFASNNRDGGKEGAVQTQDRVHHAPADFAPLVLGAGAAALLYLLFWYIPHRAELARMAAYYREHQIMPHAARSVWLNLRRGVADGERGALPYLLRLMPITCLLAVLGLWRVRGARTADCVQGLWLAGGLLFCLLSSYAPDRYYVLFLPALAGLAARGAARLGRSWQAAALGLFLLTSAFWYARAWTGHEYDRRDAAQTLRRVLPTGAVVIGDTAPAMCLDTPFVAAPVQMGLSNDNQPIERLHATYVAVRRVPVWQAWWRTRYPDVVQPSHQIAAVTLGGRWHMMVDIYTVAAKKPHL